MRLSREIFVISVVSLFGLVGSVVALRIELSATRLSAGFGQPALDYRQSPLPRLALILAMRSAADLASRDGRNRTDTIVLPRHVGLPLPSIPFCFSFSGSYGSRTHLPALKGRYPQDR